MHPQNQTGSHVPDESGLTEAVLSSPTNADVDVLVLFDRVLDSINAMGITTRLGISEGNAIRTVYTSPQESKRARLRISALGGIIRTQIETGGAN